MASPMSWKILLSNVVLRQMTQMHPIRAREATQKRGSVWPPITGGSASECEGKALISAACLGEPNAGGSGAAENPARA
jgi:hypothetical protein